MFAYYTILLFMPSRGCKQSRFVVKYAPNVKARAEDMNENTEKGERMVKELVSCAGAIAVGSCVAATSSSSPCAAPRADAPAVGETVCGFAVTSVEDLPEVEGRLVRLTYLKNGAEVAWLDRDDDNKTFAIAFKTIPGDDTGVAHIIEHSVLCGSRKYPVKDPFVDLLKSSFATFLNAWTGDDCTAYPVCSRNDADFANLMAVTSTPKRPSSDMTALRTASASRPAVASSA